MLHYPRWLAERQPEWSDVEKWELADDPDRVIQFNRRVRASAPRVFFDNRPWPPHYFVIGSEQEQNWYFLDLAEGSEAVYWFHHERGDVGEVSFLPTKETPTYILLLCGLRPRCRRREFP
jgi:hypothetical protein